MPETAGPPRPHPLPLRVDAHHHVWDLDARDQPWTAGLPALRRSFSLDDLRPSLVATGVERTVVVQTLGVTEDTSELLKLADGAPEVAGVVGWADLCSPDVAQQLAALRSQPGGDYLVGIRHLVQDEPDPNWLCRPEVWRGLRAVADAGLVYDLVVRHYHLPAVVETVTALDGVRFVLDHGGKPDIAHSEMEPWRAQVVALGRRPNIAVKLSGLFTEAGEGWALEQVRPYADVILEAFGASRVMWGSDWPVCLLATSYEDAFAATETFTESLSTSERSGIFSATARAWYSLDVNGENGKED